MEATLQIPGPEAVSLVLDQLMEGAPAFVSAKTGVDLGELGAAYASLLVADDDRVIGAIVADLPTVAFYGGMLMMTPEGGIKDQVDSGQVQSSIVEAFSEVVNVLTRAFNSIEGNLHVRSRSVLPLAESTASEAGSWLANASHGLLMSGRVSLGETRMLILVR